MRIEHYAVKDTAVRRVLNRPRSGLRTAQELLAAGDHDKAYERCTVDGLPHGHEQGGAAGNAKLHNECGDESLPLVIGEEQQLTSVQRDKRPAPKPR
jgi:hypothetical protein